MMSFALRMVHCGKGRSCHSNLSPGLGNLDLRLAPPFAAVAHLHEPCLTDLEGEDFSFGVAYQVHSCVDNVLDSYGRFPLSRGPICPFWKVNFINPIMRTHRYLPLTVIALVPFVTNVSADTMCINSGSLALEGDATDTSLVKLHQPGAIAAGTDYSTEYDLGAGDIRGAYTRLAHKPILNSTAPFSIEFWAFPYGTDDDDAPVDNRIATGNRSGWAFFQRETGWNFRMYNGNGNQMAYNLTGGPAPLNTWSHVVVTWDGAVAKLYVNGTQANVPNEIPVGQSTAYNPSTTATLTIASLGDGGSPFRGRVDEVAFYPSALTAEKISAHYTTASSTVPEAYANLVKADGALVYYQQNPATISIADAGANKAITFRGKLARSTDLNPETWEELSVTSPYTVTPTTEVPKQFFRAHR